MLAIRLVKTAMVASTALFALLVAYNNLADYNSNYEFVRHTLSMDTTFPDNALKGRAITSPILWMLAYWSIILAGSKNHQSFLPSHHSSRPSMHPSR